MSDLPAVGDLGYWLILISNVKVDTFLEWRNLFNSLTIFRKTSLADDRFHDLSTSLVIDDSLKRELHTK